MHTLWKILEMFIEEVEIRYLTLNVKIWIIPVLWAPAYED